MSNEQLAKDLDDLVNKIDPTLFPYKKGNSIRIGSYAIRSNKFGFNKVYDVKENCLIAETHFKTSAVALAKSLSKGESRVQKIISLDREMQKWFNDCVFYKHNMKKTKDYIKYDVLSMRYDQAKDKTSDLKRELDKYIYA